MCDKIHKNLCTQIIIFFATYFNSDVIILIQKTNRGNINMSKFSSYLNEIIKRSGEPIARIAKNAELERTSIHKALKDERILPYSSLKKLIRYFQLTLPEARELNLYYDMLLQGEDAYYIHSEICKLMSDLSSLHFSSYGYKTDISGGASTGIFAYSRQIRSYVYDSGNP